MVSFNLLEQFVLVKSYEIHQLLLNSSLSVSEKIHPPPAPAIRHLGRSLRGHRGELKAAPREGVLAVGLRRYG